MKRFFSMLLIVAMTFTLSVSVSAASGNLPQSELSALQLAVTSYPEELLQAAARNLADIKQTFLSAPEVTNFTSTELQNLQLGHPFSIYLTDSELAITPSANYVFPLLLENNLVATLEGGYNIADGDYSFTFQKDELYGSLQKSIFEGSSVVLIGRTDAALFATDGVTLEVLFSFPSSSIRSNNLEQVKNAYWNYIHSNSLTSSPILNGVTVSTQETPNNSPQPSAVYPYPLPIPHVSQPVGTNCGTAAWATVLNFRFGSFILAIAWLMR